MTISVVIPACNEEALLGQCLTALALQTRLPDEIIVVDNSSNDSTAAIARRYNARVIQQVQSGIWPTAAAGYDAATSECIARIDADTLVPETWVETIITSLVGGTDAITGPADFYGCKRVRATLGKVLYMRAYFTLVGLALGQTPLFGSNFAMRTTAWKKARTLVHSSRSDLHDDIDLSYSIKTIAYIPAMKVCVSSRALRRTPSGITRQFLMGFRTIFLHWPEEAPWRRNRLLRRPA